jgi:hypothetical protein
MGAERDRDRRQADDGDWPSESTAHTCTPLTLSIRAGGSTPSAAGTMGLVAGAWCPQGRCGAVRVTRLTQGTGLGSTPGQPGRIDAPDSAHRGVRGEGETDLRIRLRKINCRQCEVAHTSSAIGELFVASSPASAGGGRAVEGAMMRTNLWSESVPRVELDQRSRAARLRRERIDRLLPPVAVTQSRLRRLLCFFSVGIYGGAP